MKTHARTNALVTGIVASAPALLVPSIALAEVPGNVVIASFASSVTGAALGAACAGGIGYAALRHERREFQAALASATAQRFEDTGEIAVTDTSVVEVPLPDQRALASEPPVPEAAPRFDLPDPLEATPSAAYVSESDERPAVAPGHSAVSTGAFGEGAPRFTPSPENPYLQAEALEASQAAAVRSNDYADVATAYVARKGFTERMAIRARGVASVLGERLARDPMEGVPAIQRADGTVFGEATAGQGAEANWWQPEAAPAAAQPAAAQPAAIQPAAIQPVAAVIAAPAAAQPAAARPAASVTAQPVRDLDEPAALGAPVEGARPSTGAEERSRAITRRVPTVEEEAYPELDSAWREQADSWDEALVAMDERVEDNLMAGREERAARARRIREARRSKETRQATREVAPVPAAFADAVGNIETLDEPDGLEGDTQFLNFKAPGNHPEVQDTGSYINYLIEDEFKRNPSRHARNEVRRYFRVHEGGQPTQAQAM